MSEYAPKQSPIPRKSISLGGKIGRLCDNITKRWLIGIRETNPAILDVLRDADLEPTRVLLPWSGEFPGKYLTAAIEIYSFTHDAELGEYIGEFIDALLSCQQEDGYLGALPKGFHFEKHSPEMNYDFEISDPKHELMWDAWGHYHIMYGLMLWYRLNGSKKALSAAERIADLLCSVFYTEENKKLSDTGSEECNMSPVHSMAELYKITGKKKYLDFALAAAEDFSAPTAGDYIKLALEGKDFFEMPKPRWESLHSVEGVASLYEITEDSRLLRALLSLWESMTRGDLHNTGGFTTGEKAQGNPFEFGAIETCCTISYMALTRDVLRITGESRYADILEWCFYNTGIGAFSPSGRWSTYDTPMEGFKRANYHSVGFQSRPGAPDLNCCSVNAPRAVGLLTDWAYTADGGTLFINYYGENTASLDINGKKITIGQETAYPYDGKITLRISGGTDKMKLRLRIPFWSEKTIVSFSGESFSPKPGYFEIDINSVKDGEIELNLDMRARLQAGENRLSGKACVFAGPMLLCFDPSIDRETKWKPLPEISARDFTVEKVDTSAHGALYYCLSRGKRLTLCDLYTAGVSGAPYTTWLACRDCPVTPFSLDNPARTSRPD